MRGLATKPTTVGPDGARVEARVEARHGSWADEMMGEASPAYGGDTYQMASPAKTGAESLRAAPGRRARPERGRAACYVFRETDLGTASPAETRASGMLLFVQGDGSGMMVMSPGNGEPGRNGGERNAA